MVGRPSTSWDADRLHGLSSERKTVTAHEEDPLRIRPRYSLSGRLFRRLEQGARSRWCQLHLASGVATPGALGRVGLTSAVLRNEWKYQFRGVDVSRIVLRTASDIGKLVDRIRPSAVICMGQVGNLSHWWLALNKKRFRYALICWQCGYEYHPGVLKAALLNRFVPRFEHHLAYHTNARPTPSNMALGRIR